MAFIIYGSGSPKLWHKLVRTAEIELQSMPTFESIYYIMSCSIIDQWTLSRLFSALVEMEYDGSLGALEKLGKD